MPSAGQRGRGPQPDWKRCGPIRDISTLHSGQILWIPPADKLDIKLLEKSDPPIPPGALDHPVVIVSIGAAGSGGSRMGYISIMTTCKGKRAEEFKRSYQQHLYPVHPRTSGRYPISLKLDPPNSKMDKEGYVKVDTLHRVDMAILEYYGEWYGKLKLTPESLKTLQKKVLKPQQGDKRQQLKFEFQAHAAASLNRATTVVQEVPLDVQPYHLLNEETDSAFFVPPPKQDRAHQSNRQLPPRQDRAHHSTRQPLLPPHSKQYRVAHSTHQQLLRTPDITSDLPQYYQTFPPRESHWQGRRSVLPRIRSLPSAPSIPWSSILKFLAVCAIFGLLGYSTYFLGSKIFTGVRSVWAAALTSWRGLKGWLGLHIL